MNYSVVVVTGGSGGIGKSIIKKYLREGFFVVSADLKNTNDFEHENFSFLRCNVENECLLCCFIIYHFQIYIHIQCKRR